MSRATALKTGALRPKSSAGVPPGAPVAPHPSATLPPGARVAKPPRPGEDTARSKNSFPPRKPAGAPPPVVTEKKEPAPRKTQPASPLEEILAELHAIRHTQSEILGLLRSEAAPGHSAGPAGSSEGAVLEAVRTRRRKSVLLIDDDAATREAAVAEFEQAAVPVRAVQDGNAALRAIAEDRPDVIVLEVGIGGEMPGKDLVNVVKATMEWVDIPLLLYTREPIGSQKEARTVHGADDLVPKQSGSAALLSRVITFFRRP